MINYKFLWLDGIFDEKTVQSFPATSPASVFWQKGFVQSLQNLGNKVEVIGFPSERIWPFGRLWIGSGQANLLPGLNGTIVSYMNFPLIRSTTQYWQLSRVVKRFLTDPKNRPDYLVTYSCAVKPSDVSSATLVAKKIRKEKGILWICIVADGIAPLGADGYVYLTWSYHQSRLSLAPSIHIDGGVPAVNTPDNPGNVDSIKVLMYMGALTQHGGASILARAFHSLSDKGIQLWVCGRGENKELENLAKVDQRIKLLGFVNEAELDKLALSAMAFANPRPTSFEPNKLNYPSKLLHYLGYGKPVISTFTEGLSPEYADVLLSMPEETEDGVAKAIKNVLSMNEEQYSIICKRISKFNKKHTWDYQVNRFLTWLQDEV